VLSALSRGLRTLFQSAVLGLGAYLVIRQDLTAGMIIASSIITARALAPVDTAIAHWRQFLGARTAWTRLRSLMAAAPAGDPPLKLPAPAKILTVEGLTGGPPGSERLTIVDATFTLKAGTILGVIGPSASGKSSLVRLMIGIWRPVRGRVRIDGATLDRWDPEDLGNHIGYLPQAVGLFDGTIAENIARFAPERRDEAVLRAAEAAKVHDMILKLPEGYETRIGEGGVGLSAGQQQRVALARALYGDPFIVILDEPNSNLDSDGDRALSEALAAVRERGGIGIVVAHRPNVLGITDMVMVVNDNRIQTLGPRDEILPQVLRPAQVVPAPAPPRPAPPREAAQ
jgi:PrtD family type I secretion system ABC transporter